MTMTITLGEDDEQTNDQPVLSPDPDTPGPEAGEYVHPEGVPGDPAVDNSQLG